ncbi:MAG: insulinase family protein [Croceibacterium sp.]
MIRRFLAALLLLAAVPAVAQTAPVDPRHEWPFARSDLPADPGYRFGRLANGMRYVIRANATPKGTGMVQLWVDDGSIAETDAERGYAHFIEHMAFNGTTHVPEGEMVRLLEREGLAFGADTNASTSYDVTLYKLDLPRNDPALLDTALMLMRETASELAFDPAAIEREKSVVLSERRTRDTYALHNYRDGIVFAYAGARFVDRLPIGTAESVQNATAAGLRAFYRRTYRPENTALVVVGDFDPAAVEAEIARRFGDWQGAPLVPRSDPGPVPLRHGGATEVYLDPALAERVVVSRTGAWRDHVDTLAWRQGNLRRQLGYAIVNRRLQRLARSEHAPFRGAALGTSDLFHAARTSQLIIDSGDGEWQAGLAAAQAEYRRALQFGFTPAEVAEQVANLRTGLENAARGSGTRSNAAFIGGALGLLQDGQIPTTPESALQRFEAWLPEVTPASVLAALTEDLVPFDKPLIRFEGRRAPVGGARALRDAWNQGQKIALTPPQTGNLAQWGYTQFGPPGAVVSDTTEPLLGVRKLRFANGLKVSLKTTDLQRNAISLALNIDGGQLLNTRANPLATAMDDVLPVGGLGKHSMDELQSILAGRSVTFRFGADAETFVLGGVTTPRDLELQLQVLAAAVSDPGYRPQGEEQYRRNIRNFFARLNATPEDALGNNLGRILSDNDPRFTLQPMDAYLKLSFAKLRTDISDRLAHGAMELALVGDFDEPQTIALIARTLGALPAREPEFLPHADNRQRSFTADRGRGVIAHDGPADQAIVRFTWPTRDDADFTEELKLELLERVMQLQLTDTLREQLGETYSPGVNASEPETWPGYGTFTIAAQVDAAKIGAARSAMVETVRQLIAAPVTGDVLLRARQPMVEAYDNALKSNRGWMDLVERAQRKPERIGRFMSGKRILGTLTPAQIQATAARYLQPGQAIEIDVLPRAQAR